MTDHKPKQLISLSESVTALKRSGYLLESRVDSALREAEFRVETNSLIPDDSTGKMRELDLWAAWANVFAFGSDDESSLTLELAIECVHPPQPLAFIMKERPGPLFERTQFWDALKIVGNPPESHGSPHYSWSWLAAKLDLNRYHHYRTKRVATQYCSFTKKQSGGEWMASHRDEDHQTFRKLCMATDHFVRALIIPDYSRTAGWDLTLVYPLLVVQGQLLEVTASKRSARVRRTDHVQYRLSQVVNGEENDYCVDVITERFLGSYVNTLLREMRLMVKRLDARYAEFREFRQKRERNYAADVARKRRGTPHASAV